MGMSMAVGVFYGLAWPMDQEPRESYNYEEDGVPVGPGGALQWGTYGYTDWAPGRCLMVSDSYRGGWGSTFVRIPEVTEGTILAYDLLITDYCKDIGLRLDVLPGWHAVGYYG